MNGAMTVAPEAPASEGPLARLSPQQLEEIGAELDAIRDRVMADLGDREGDASQVGGAAEWAKGAPGPAIR